MNKTLIIVLVCVGFCCVAIGGGAFLMFNKAKQVAEEAIKAGDQSLKTMSESWSLDDLKKVASPELLGQFSEAQLRAELAKFSPLGKCNSVKGTIDGIEAHKDLSGGDRVEIKYVGLGQFANGECIVKLTLIQRPDKPWQVLGFSADPNDLPKAKDSGAANQGDPQVPTDDDGGSETPKAGDSSGSGSGT